MKWIKLYESYRTDKLSNAIDIKKKAEKELSDLYNSVKDDVSEYLYDITDSHQTTTEVSFKGSEFSGKIEVTMMISSSSDKLDKLIEDLYAISDRLHDALDMSISFLELINAGNNISYIDWCERPLSFIGDDTNSSGVSRKKILFNTLNNISKNYSGEFIVLIKIS